MKWQINWQTIVVVISLIFNGLLAYVVVSDRAEAAGTAVSIPVLPPNQGYIFNINDRTPSCVDVETKLGLVRGSVEKITNSSEEGIKVYFSKNTTITSTQVDTLTQIANKYISKIETVVK